MGGFTKILLSDTSRDNIDRHNARLRLFGVPRQYRFYSRGDMVEEYEYYCATMQGKPTGAKYPDSLFPRASINSFEDFLRYWNPRVVGEVLVPPVGMLTFDCYFSRTSKRAMCAIGKYLVANVSAIQEVGGSFTTFMERGMTVAERREFTSRCNPYIRVAINADGTL